MPNEKLGGRWVELNESPFGDRNSKDNQVRRALYDPKKTRNAQLAEYMNRRSGRRFSKP